MSIRYKGKVISGVSRGLQGEQGPRGPAGPDGNPIGTVISYMGLTAPQDYLVCDGVEYNITDYSELAKFFETQFGAKNHFGGDGTITFAVPDLQGEGTSVLYCIKSTVSLPKEVDSTVSETYGPSPEVTVDMAIPETLIEPISEIKMVQEGSGTASLTNIRNFVGWDGVTLTFNGEASTQSFPETVYDASYDWAKGELKITHKVVSFDVADMNYDENFPGWKNCTWLNEIFDAKINGHFDSPVNVGNRVAVTFGGPDTDPTWWIVSMPIATYGLTQTQWKAQHPDLTITMSFPLLVPRKIQLTPSEFLAINGNNILSSNTGNTTAIFRVDLKKYIEKRIADALSGTA